MVSVILAVRNGRRYLREALDSVVGQDYPDFEVVVVDGQSTDGTAAIIRSYPAIRYVWQEGRGIADAWNTGIAAAYGDLLAFMSCDDLWPSHKLSRQAAFMAERPSLQYSVTLMRFFLQEGQAPPPGFRRELLAGEPVGLCMEALMARRSVFDHIGGFDTAFYPCSEDTDWFARAIDAGVEMAVLREVLLEKRIHSESTVATGGSEVNNLLLRALRASIARKRTHPTQEQG